MSHLAENEQRKLTATFLNGIAIAFFAVGGIAPLVGLFSRATHADWLTVARRRLLFMGLSALIHRLARRTLEGLPAMTIYNLIPIAVFAIGGLVLAFWAYCTATHGDHPSR